MSVRVFLVAAMLRSCPADLLDDEVYLEKGLRDAVTRAGLTLLSTHMEKFQPQGVTGVAILGESHLAVHSWPESGELFVDVATCSTPESTRICFDEILALFPGAVTDSYHEVELDQGASAARAGMLRARQTAAVSTS
jgi:S-adenosylmethionine decarboxylase